jgi:SPX domain protein involved in polyphosphate accumulation
MKFGDLMTFLKNEPGINLFIDKALYPTLQVAYKRKYFEGGQGIRVTLDSDIHYYKTPLHSKISSSQPISYPMTIMEVKFHPDLVKVVSSSFKEFHLIPKRHSKYLIGISMLGSATYL